MIEKKLSHEGISSTLLAGTNFMQTEYSRHFHYLIKLCISVFI